MNRKEEKLGIFVYALNKTASMFLYKIYKDLSEEKQLPYFSVNNNPSNVDELKQDIKSSFCICPIRSFPLITDNYQNVQQKFHIFQVRDPRDILVSQYFSFGWIHPVEAENSEEARQKIRSLTIDEYVLSRSINDEPFISTNNPMESLKHRYQPLLEYQKNGQPNILVVKYEEMVTDYMSWLSKAIAPFQFENKTEILQKYFQKYKHEFEIKQKDVMEHKRHVTPGDYQNKLKPETIEKLNSIFDDVLTTFNYL